MKDKNMSENISDNSDKRNISPVKERIKNYVTKIKDYDDKSRFSLFLGTGLYQICIGLILTLLVSLLIRLPIQGLNLYPYLTVTVLSIVKIIGWIIIAFGIYTCLYPFIRQKLTGNELLEKITRFPLIVSIIITFLLIPIGPFLGLVLKSEIQKPEKTERKDKSVAKIYFSLLFITGLIHVLFGFLIIYFLPDLFWDNYTKIYPMITVDLLNFLIILGWISLIPGAILMVCAFSSWKFSRVEKIEEQGIILKIVRNMIIFSSIFIVIVFPIGTFFGLTIIQEFYALKEKEVSD
jgi:hypothetical protein